MVPRSRLREFLLPTPNRRFFIRASLLAFSTWFMFSYILVPVRIRGISMEPTFHDGQVRFCLRAQYLFSPPALGDVVAIRYSGPHFLLAKRVVALEGDLVEFRDGTLWVNGEARAEPYLTYRGDWNLDPRRVAQGRLYVVGDNRGLELDQHEFGQTDRDRVLGRIL